jgi:NAD-dependent SIR2 family protein deacetylase
MEKTVVLTGADMSTMSGISTFAMQKVHDTNGY